MSVGASTGSASSPQSPTPPTGAASQAATATQTPASVGAAVTPSPGHEPSPTPAPVPPTATPAPASTPAPARTPTATPAAQPAGPATGEGVVAYALSSDFFVYAEPDTESEPVAQLSYEQPIALLGAVRGERVVVGDQTWPMAEQDWTDLWYQVDGGYVYAADVWIPGSGDVLPDLLPAGERWVDVDLSNQTATLMIDDTPVYTALVTTGKAGYETPTGVFHVQYEVLNETMTSAQAGITNPAEQYDVQNVLFTQYFDFAGDALHLNYWQPEAAFGSYPTSHGCVGLYLNDAQYFWLFGRDGMVVDIHY
ncbi:MAG TPA: L,D-transpeptidase [Dehalococcoidia bacterium]|nr:L,D-transpeptidase [Dehalococcoidia bacterium]